jgi:hypothetical protein
MTFPFCSILEGLIDKAKYEDAEEKSTKLETKVLIQQPSSL